jgi:hypothetical protein
MGGDRGLNAAFGGDHRVTRAFQCHLSADKATELVVDAKEHRLRYQPSSNTAESPLVHLSISAQTALCYPTNMNSASYAANAIEARNAAQGWKKQCARLAG